ncbi:hypothetical protein CKO40_05775 [Halochromatium glycolicum]|uniref:DUF2177 family protein n=2 Tax=Halochromatium glycolicum TaxID=85075 RepID=A0AAJ0U2V1_9GAMM|nr:hypothetical protein [Halochromatium glycolicum]
MAFYLRLYLFAVPVFFVVDLVWLGVVAPSLYQHHIGHLLADQVDWTAAISFYLIYTAGILVFAVAPGLVSGSLRRTALSGAGFGFFTYITYQLTNRATLPDWPWEIVWVDTLWGVVLCTVVAVMAHLIGKRIG